MQVTIDIPDHRIADLLCAAWEGGSNYWAEANGTPYEEDKSGNVAQGTCGQLRLKLSPLVRVWDREGGGNKSYTLTREKLSRGLHLMAAKAPRQFGEFLADDADAITADVFLQCAVLGDIIYG